MTDVLQQSAARAAADTEATAEGPSRVIPALRMGQALAIESEVIAPENPVHATVAFARTLPISPEAPVTPTPPTRPLIGLALSGGGIRSATFSLGVLQALAARGKLASFDYLSTVSGGGYIGSWLSAWVHRAGMTDVQARLGESGSLSSKGSPSAAEPSEVTWLRRYSNYLAPRVGLLSFDALTLLTTWLRNVALNAVVILGFLCAVLVMPFLLLQLVRFSAPYYVTFGFAGAWFGIMFFGVVGYNLWQQSMKTKRKRNWLISTPGVVATVVTPGLLACGFTAVWLGSGPAKTGRDALYACAYVGILLVLLLATWAVAEYLKPRDERMKPGDFAVIALAAPIAFAAGILALMALYTGWHALLDSATDMQRQIMLLLAGPPAVVFAFGVATTVFTGMVGRVYFERSREWWSRLNAWLLSLGTGWAVWIALAFLTLPLLHWLFTQIGHWIGLLGTGWIGSLLATVLFKKPEAASKRMQMNVDSALNIAATVFIAGLLVVLSALVSWSLLRLADVPLGALAPPTAVAKATYEITGPGRQLAYTVAPPADKDPSLATTLHAYMNAFGAIEDASVLGGYISMPAIALLGLFGIVMLFAARVDINKFSLHNMYKNRLVRCYLGASNQASRNEQPFTGLDDADDLPLSALGGSVDATGTTRSRAQRPLHIINTALNITQGNNLAWQERKAASFIFTPVVCGYSLERTQGDSTAIDDPATGAQPGYRLTAEYGANDVEEKGFTLGMALATSGAAVSPNMGHASRPARAFVLTLFNVRLGRWSANPAREMWRKPSPRFGLVPLLQELFGYSNESRNFVYLSDGGHFDNLGIYELVRRRCSTILVVDAGADPERRMGDLAETVRKCRVDLGVEIDLPELPLLEGDEQMQSLQGYAKGVIHYDLMDPAQDGTLILIKPSMTRSRDEPVDVLNYASQNPPFPQQATSDQFFDESQFESYRRLGAFIAEECLNQHGALFPPRPAGHAPAPVAQPAEPAAHSTRFVGRLLSLFGRPKARPLPSRDGALVDMHGVALFLSLVVMLLFGIFDALYFGGSTRFCVTRAACETSLAPFFEVGRASPIRFMVRAGVDNLFVLLYATMFISGFLVALQRASAPTFARRYVLPVLCLIVLGAAAADLAENLQTIGWVETLSDNPARAIAGITRTKFVLVGLGFLAWLVLARGIWRVFRKRWG